MLVQLDSREHEGLKPGRGWGSGAVEHLVSAPFQAVVVLSLSTTRIQALIRPITT